VLLQMGGNSPAHAGVDHHHIAVRFHEKDDGIVDGPALIVQKGAVNAATR
jgi:hypothetical protein